METVVKMTNHLLLITVLAVERACGLGHLARQARAGLDDDGAHQLLRGRMGAVDIPGSAAQSHATSSVYTKGRETVRL